MNIKKLKNVPVAILNVSGSKLANIDPPAIYWSAIIVHWIKIIAIVIITPVFLSNKSCTSPVTVLCPLFLKRLTTKKLATIAPNAQATLYHPADNPATNAFWAIPMVDAPPIANPAIVTAVIQVPFLPLYNKKFSPSFFSFFDINIPKPNKNATYNITIINGVFII